jgi:hypothetical protein
MGLHEFLSDALNEGRAGSGEFARLSAALHESGLQSHGRGRGASESERGEVRGRRGGQGGPGGFGGRGRGGHGRPDGAGRQWQGAGPEQVSPADVLGWLTGRLPDGWLTGPPQVTVDRDEIIIVGPLATPEVPKTAGEEADGDATAAAVAAAEAGRISRFREDTREERIRIAVEAEHRYGRKVAWGATAGATTELFTTMSVPVMTRLRQPERAILDTLVDAGVARSRSDALAWCVRLVGEHTEDWLGQLREAMTAVERVRAEGPKL